MVATIYGFDDPIIPVLIVGFIISGGIAATVFWIVELIDAARREYFDTNMKAVWLLVIFFGHFVGGLIYYFVGKRMEQLPSEQPRGGY